MATSRVCLFCLNPAGTREDIWPLWLITSIGADSKSPTEYTELYRLINPMASSFIHETMYGLLRHFRAADDPHRVEVPPTLKWSKEALSGAHNGMVGVVRTLSQTFAIAPEPTVEVLEQDWRYAWTDPR